MVLNTIELKAWESDQFAAYKHLMQQPKAQAGLQMDVSESSLQSSFAEALKQPYFFQILLDDQLIGSVTLYWALDQGEDDLTHYSLAYSLDEAYEHHGYMHQALEVLFRHMHGPAIVQAEMFADNTASIHVVEGLGFTKLTEFTNFFGQDLCVFEKTVD
ncbi:N-acetyltransferase [Weissella viridescens]|uniref:N-acetyltransferase n=1 Tax=Weissella viridescens TaxID=1629 RepID=A0A3P2RBA6_WEIVI|nr:GNAT family N-acetyltransferase [Weissella viridescens]RRG18037.1 N-acetyltransferase [Weissella viridescens]